MKNDNINLLGLKGTNIEDYYKVQFNCWKFDNSDEVKLDGEVLSKNEKIILRMSLRGKNKVSGIIEMSDIVDGNELTEHKFIELEINRVNNIKDLSLGKDLSKQKYLQFLLEKENAKPPQQNKTENDYSQRQVAIAYCVLGKPITTENYLFILEKYSQTRSKKILQKRTLKISDLSKLSEVKSTDTKNLKDLQEAKRLLSGIKNKEAVKDISRIITAFLTSYNNHY